jgi:hypothetical protein
LSGRGLLRAAPTKLSLDALQDLIALAGRIPPRRIVSRTIEGAAPTGRAISRLDIPADFNVITSRTWRITSLSVGIQVPLRKAERRDRIGTRRGLATRARSSRNSGRDHLGMAGEIERNQ